jgi:hypothetical protein
LYYNVSYSFVIMVGRFNWGYALSAHQSSAVNLMMKLLN